MTIVRHTVTGLDGAPIPRVAVSARLIVPAWDGPARVLYVQERQTNEQGVAEFDLIPNENLVPEGTYYVLRSAGDHDLTIVVVPSAEPRDSSQLQVTMPPPVGETSGLALHVTAPDPHPQYTSAEELQTAIATALADYPTGAEVDASIAAALDTHTGEGDPHPGYTTDAEVTATVTAALDVHTGATDPHPGYASDTDVATAVADAVAAHDVDPESHPDIRSALGDGGGVHDHPQYVEDAELDAAVDAAVTAAVDPAIGAHDVDPTAHADIRALIGDGGGGTPGPEWTTDAELAAAIDAHAATPHGGEVTPGAPVADATDTGDVVQQFNALLTSLRDAGLLEPPLPDNVLFFDDFDGDTLGPMWFAHDHPAEVNEELQYYTPDNVTVRDSLLVITAEERTIGANLYASGLVTTAGRFEYLYGLAEARMKLVTGQGKWPSRYFLENGSAPYFGGTQPGFPGGTQLAEGWPTDGFSEVDWPEHAGSTPTQTHANRHWNDVPNESLPGLGFDYLAGVDLSADFHVYGLDWSPSHLTFLFDGVPVYRIAATATTIPFNPMFFIFNYAVGGVFDGDPPPDADFPDELQIDWVRVTAPPALQPISELVADFETTAEPFALLNGAALVDGGIVAPTDQGYSVAETTTRHWDLTGRAIWTPMSEVPVDGLGSTQAFLMIVRDPAHLIQYGKAGGNLVAEYVIPDATTGDPTYNEVLNVPYDAVAHYELRISEAGGVIEFATRPAGGTWTTQGTVPVVDLTFPIDGVNIRLNSGYWNPAEVAPVGQARWEGVNVTPA